MMFIAGARGRCRERLRIAGMPFAADRPQDDLLTAAHEFIRGSWCGERALSRTPCCSGVSRRRSCRCRSAPSQRQLMRAIGRRTFGATHDSGIHSGRIGRRGRPPTARDKFTPRPCGICRIYDGIVVHNATSHKPIDLLWHSVLGHPSLRRGAHYPSPGRTEERATTEKGRG
jgi:hypothetical protein